ncbi:MAG: AI-2E family transporter [Acidobacteria bacterium]|nr:AI-2E family transporter [Acidobacteriota bacterium]
MIESYGPRRSLIVLSVLAIAVAGLVYLLLLPFLHPIFFALVLAIAAQPLYHALASRLKRPALSASLTTLLMIVAVLVPLAMLTVTVINEATSSYNRLAQQSAEKGGWGQYLNDLLDPPVQWVADKTGMPAPNVQAAVLQRMQAMSSGLLRWSGSLLGNLTSTLGDLVLSLFVMFFLFLEGNAIWAGILRWMPLPESRTRELLQTISDAIVANVYGFVAVGVAQGVLTGLAFWFTGLHAPFLWGAVAAICSLVPIVGTAIVWVPAALILLAQAAWGKALFMLLWGVLAISMSDNIIRPLVLSGRTEMNTLVVFFALMGGLQAFGFIGLFAGPVIFSVAIAVFRMLREEYTQPMVELEIKEP